MSKCSHEGHMPHMATGHLKKMQAEHGVAAAAGNKPVGGAKANAKFDRKAAKAGRKGA